jgi:phenylacetic acid degradation protein
VPAYAIDGVIPVVDPTAFVHPAAVLIGDVVVGAGCYVGPGRETTVGANGHIGHRVALHGCRIGAGAMIGIGSIVMDGAVIGEQALLGAHSFVPADATISDRCLALGSPAREVRALTDAEVAWQANGPRLYQELAARSLASLHAVDPLPARPAQARTLGISSERATPLREFRRAGHR